MGHAKQKLACPAPGHVELQEMFRASLTMREGCNVPGKILSDSATNLVQMTLKGRGISVSPPFHI